MSSIPHGAGSEAEAELAKLRAKVETLMAERVTPAVTALAGEAEAMARGAGVQARDAVDLLSERVRERPLAAVGVAMLAGAALFALLRR